MFIITNQNIARFLVDIFMKKLLNIVRLLHLVFSKIIHWHKIPLNAEGKWEE
jgi:hypothetical protein